MTRRFLISHRAWFKQGGRCHQPVCTTSFSTWTHTRFCHTVRYVETFIKCFVNWTLLCESTFIRFHCTCLCIMDFNTLASTAMQFRTFATDRIECIIYYLKSLSSHSKQHNASKNKILSIFLSRMRTRMKSYSRLFRHWYNGRGVYYIHDHNYHFIIYLQNSV